MEEGRVIIMAFSDFTCRLCERIRFRYYLAPGDRGVSSDY